MSEIVSVSVIVTFAFKLRITDNQQPQGGGPGRRAREERHRQQAEELGRGKDYTPPRERREELECRRLKERAWVDQIG